MIINKVLDEVFSTWSNIAVLRVLNKVKIGLSGREVAKQAGMSAPSCHKALSSLENLNLVIHERGGRDHFFYLNREHFITQKIIAPIISQEIKFEETLFVDIIANLKNHSTSIFLFGSVVRQEETIASDLDICIVYKNHAGKTVLEKKVSESRVGLHKKYGISLAPFYISENDFVRRMKFKKPPVADIVNEGKLLFGKSIKELKDEQSNN